jgi:hypothetical protein
MKCGAQFSMFDQFMNDTFNCTLDVHSGPHVDTDKGFTWGVTDGDDGYTKQRRHQIHEQAERRFQSARIFKRRKWSWK